MPEYTHFDAQGNAIMVDVSRKEKTERQATAMGRIVMAPACYHAVKEGAVQKGDVLGIARVAGIMGLKQTSALIPLCHPLPIEQASLDFGFIDQECAITVSCTAKTFGATGVEMEALTGASIALLTIYDMCKALDKGMVLGDIHLQKKTGGKSGVYEHRE